MVKMGRPKKKASERKSRLVTVRFTPGEHKELMKVGRSTGLKEMNAIVHHCVRVALQTAEVYCLLPTKLTPVPEDLLPQKKP